MITRRRLLETPGVGAMLAGLGLAFPRMLTTEAEAQPILNLSPMLPEGTRSEAILDTLPGKKPLIKLSYWRRRSKWRDPAHPEGIEATPGFRGGCRVSMLGKSPRIVPTACRRRRMGLWRHGLCALEGGTPEGRPRHSRLQERNDRNRFRRC